MIHLPNSFTMVHSVKGAGTSFANSLLEKISEAEGLICRGYKDFDTTLPAPKGDVTPIGKHSTADHIRDFLGAEAYDRTFSFMVSARNPYDRVVSWYYHCKRVHAADPSRWAEEANVTFDEYMERKLFYPVTLMDMIRGKDGRILVDYVVRFENLVSDFRFIRDRIGLFGANLVRRNVNTKYATDDRAKLTERQRKIVEAHFANELHLFNW